jgi:hypothetical protein
MEKLLRAQHATSKSVPWDRARPAANFGKETCEQQNPHKIKHKYQTLAIDLAEMKGAT